VIVNLPSAVDDLIKIMAEKKRLFIIGITSAEASINKANINFLFRKIKGKILKTYSRQVKQ